MEMHFNFNEEKSINREMLGLIQRSLLFPVNVFAAVDFLLFKTPWYPPQHLKSGVFLRLNKSLLVTC